MTARTRNFRFWLFLLVAMMAGSAVIAESPADQDLLKIDGLGRGSVALSGPWHFHVGDDAGWAQAGVDDTPGHDGWESIAADRPWGAQSHYAYAGFGWYRLHLQITPAPGYRGTFQLKVPEVIDCYEVYWNGARIGTYGHMPPGAWWPAASRPEVFTIPANGSGVLALRVWSGPLGSSATGYGGGLTAAPEIGDEESIAGKMAEWKYGVEHSNLYSNAMNLLYLLVGIAGFTLWLRRRDRTLLWFAVFAICPVSWTSIYALHLGVSNYIADFYLQPIFALRNVALWYLLLDMLKLTEHKALVRWAKWLAIVSLVAAFLDGCLIFIQPVWDHYSVLQWADAVLTVITTACEAYALVLVAAGVRQKLDPARWVLAMSAFVAQMLTVFIAASQQGQRFTHWTIAQKLYTPLFFLDGVYVNAQLLADTALFLSILYAIYRYLQDQQTRKAALEQELLSARELQRILIPDEMPKLPGYQMSSAYRPALEVGGDFFQIIPLEDGTLIVLGDVSGKGLRAAMAVSLIVGTLRTLANLTSKPSEILVGLNRQLHGRLKDGFTTCLALRLDAAGTCTMASAGHPAPLLNGKEIELPGALPLGIDPGSDYEERTIHMRTGDRFALYTDGLLEARAGTGELFSFDRLEELFASATDARKASEAAVAFGQEDDITVLTFTRVAYGESLSTVSVSN